MDRFVKLILNTIVMVILLMTMVNILGIYSTYNRIQKVARVMIFYAQKNGGFVDAYDKEGNLVTDVESFFNTLIVDYNLEDTLKSEGEQSEARFSPGLGERVSRRTIDNADTVGYETELNSARLDSFRVRLEAEYQVELPFASNYNIDLPAVEEIGFSQKYFKE